MLCVRVASFCVTGGVEETVFYGKIGGTASAVVRPMWDRTGCVFCFAKKNLKIKIKRGYENETH